MLYRYEVERCIVGVGQVLSSEGERIVFAAQAHCCVEGAVDVLAGVVLFVPVDFAYSRCVGAEGDVSEKSVADAQRLLCGGVDCVFGGVGHALVAVVVDAVAEVDRPCVGVSVSRCQ